MDIPKENVIDTTRNTFSDQMGSPAESVLPLKSISCKQVAHFDEYGVALRCINNILKVVKYFAEQRDVWADGQWDGESVTCLWDGIFEDLQSFLLTVTNCNDGKPDSYHKSKCGNLSCQTCYDKFINAGIFKQLNIQSGVKE